MEHLSSLQVYRIDCVWDSNILRCVSSHGIRRNGSENFALTDPEKVCQLAATHRVFCFAFKPVIWFLNQIAALLLKPFGG